MDGGRMWVGGELVGYREHAGKLHELPERKVAIMRAPIGMVFQHFNLFPHMKVMRDLAASGMTMMVVTHELSFAREVGDDLVFMADGMIVERGSPSTVLASPREPRTREFLSRVL
jgi:ABC-type polar amino acid transport system ATPase subunit